MGLNLDNYLEKIFYHFEDEEVTNLETIFESLEFKYNKTLYHLENMKKQEKEASDIEMDNYYENVYYPLYYELESFLISIRSTVDICMHLINESFSLKIDNLNVHLNSIYKHNKLPKPTKNILKKYTHNRDNLTWNFIYTYRNELVHEKSVNQSLPIDINLFHTEKPTAYFELEGQQRNLITFCSNCLFLLDRFIMHLLEAINISLELKNE